MNESEQAEAIADIKSRHENHSSAWDDVCEDCKDLLEIVDSQAQKICEQAKEIERLKYKIKAADLRGANE